MRGPDEGGGLELRKLMTFTVNNQNGLYDRISHTGATMSNGDEVVAAEGVNSVVHAKALA